METPETPSVEALLLDAAQTTPAQWQGLDRDQKTTLLREASTAAAWEWGARPENLERLIEGLDAFAARPRAELAQVPAAGQASAAPVIEAPAPRPAPAAPPQPEPTPSGGGGGGGGLFAALALLGVGIAGAAALEHWVAPRVAAMEEPTADADEDEDEDEDETPSKRRRRRRRKAARKVAPAGGAS